MFGGIEFTPQRTLEETMIRSRVLTAIAFTSALTASGVRADPLPTQTHKVLPAALAVEAAEATIAACKAQTYLVTALVADATGKPIVMIVGDGARYLTTEVTRRKAYTAALWKMSSGDFAKRFPTPTGFNPVIYDPQLAGGQGALPIKVGDDTIGAIAAAGAPGGDKDEACAQAGLDKIKDRLN
jgi:uncharacterized protein GlcG (DUF336 family)